MTDGNGATATYDAVVVATHPDQALALLQEPTAAQRAALSAIPYSENVALLHTDASLLPADRRAPAPPGTSCAGAGATGARSR